jgi:hypothetical protein
LILRFHLLFCSECRREISRLRDLFVFVKNDSLYKSSYDISTSVMNIIRRESAFNGKTISGLKWVTIGSIIFLSILLINFSESFVWLKGEFGSGYTIPMSIVMGFVLTAYATILIGCNYESIKKYLELHYKLKIK